MYLREELVLLDIALVEGQPARQEYVRGRAKQPHLQRRPLLTHQRLRDPRRGECSFHLVKSCMRAAWRVSRAVRRVTWATSTSFLAIAPANRLPNTKRSPNTVVRPSKQSAQPGGADLASRRPESVANNGASATETTHVALIQSRGWHQHAPPATCTSGKPLEREAVLGLASKAAIRTARRDDTCDRACRTAGYLRPSKTGL